MQSPRVAQQFVSIENDEHYFSPLRSARSSRSKKCAAPGFLGWELRLRRGHLDGLYGPPMLEPAYRNWEAAVANGNVPAAPQERRKSFLERTASDHLVPD